MDSELFYKYKLLKILVRRSFKFPLKFITISAFLKKEIEKSNPETHPQIVNTNSVDYQHYIFHKNGKIDPDKKIRILSVVSNYEYYKGIDLLTKTVQELKKNKSNYHFTLVSREKYKYHDIFDEFLSNPSDNTLERLYRQSDILLVTSRAEGFFIPGLEAMAAGCVVVSTNSFGILEYSKNNYNSILVEDYKDIWKKKIIDKIIKNHRLRNKLIRNGYRTIKLYISNRKIRNISDVIYQ